MWVFVYLHIRGDTNVGFCVGMIVMWVFCIYILGVIVMWVFVYLHIRGDSNVGNVGFCVFTY